MNVSSYTCLSLTPVPVLPVNNTNADNNDNNLHFMRANLVPGNVVSKLQTLISFIPYKKLIR